MLFRRLFPIVLVIVNALIFSAEASSLRISPVSVELPVSAKAATLRIRNEGKSPVTVQMRIFHWTQVDGTDQLVPTKDVVVSPPIAELQPKRDYVVRVIRTTKRPIVLEENYRLLIDELPSKTARANGTVALVIRQSLPVLFHNETSKHGEISWSALKKRGTVEIIARNTGSKRAKISSLSVSAGRRTQLLHHEGLSGYILGGSQKRWSVPTSSGEIQTGQKLHISALSSSGKIDSYATLRAGD